MCPNYKKIEFKKYFFFTQFQKYNFIKKKPKTIKKASLHSGVLASIAWILITQIRVCTHHQQQQQHAKTNVRDVCESTLFFFITRARNKINKYK